MLYTRALLLLSLILPISAGIARDRKPASLIPYAPIEEPGAVNKPDALKEFLKERYPSNWQIERSPSGAVAKLWGGQIPGSGQDLQSSYHWLMLLSGMLHFDVTHISPSNAHISREGPHKFFHFEQILDGYPVYGAEILITSRETDSALLGFENHLRTDFTDYSPIQKGAQEAKAQLKEELSSRRPKFNEEIPSIVLWPPSESQTAELAWKFRAQLQGPAESVLIFYGGNSGKLLKIDSVSAK